MLPSLKRIVIWMLFLLTFPVCLVAQQVTVKRKVNLRSEPTTASTAIELIFKGATLTLLDSTPQGGFYHVKAEDDKEGWVWSKNISVPPTTPTAPQEPSPGSTTPVTVQCDATLWGHVYNPARLIVKQQCISVTGTIVDATNGKKPDGVRHEADGDTHGWLNVDAQFKNLLNAGNISDEQGNLVFEIVCKFHATQTDAKGACPPTYQSPVEIPPVGSHVVIVGTYVQDTKHAQWMEIHPVTSITVIP